MSDASTAKKTGLIALLVVLLIVVGATVVLLLMPAKDGEEATPGVGYTDSSQPGPFEGRPAEGFGPGTPGVGEPPPPPPQPVAGVAVKKRSEHGGIPEGTAAYPRIRYVARADPFAILPVERAADERQRQQELLALLGDFQLFAEPKPKPLNPALIPVEPQPYRRLSGIVRGEAVAAILEVEGQSEPVIVQPGDRVGEWLVRSIDNEKLVLTREGDKKPNMVIVRLEASPTHLAAGGASGPGTFGPGPGPGGPTVGPGGYMGPRMGGPTAGPGVYGPPGGGGPSR